ncbi:MAG TPA: RES family NAD+ phosphorylase [Edaphobacter sp.]
MAHTAPFHQVDTHRLIPTRYLGGESVLEELNLPPKVLEDMSEIDAGTNKRITNAEGRNRYLLPNEQLFGVPYAEIVNAAFSHAGPAGGRFNPPDRGAWYAGVELTTSQAEVAYHRQRFLQDGYIEEALQEEYQDFLADFTAEFHTLDDEEAAIYLEPEPVPACYFKSQLFAFELMTRGSNGIVYSSTRSPGGSCIACFRPALVYNVRRGRQYVLETAPGRSSWSS